MSELTILKALVSGGMSVMGACAMGGNMMAESNMQANIAQRGMTKLTDAQYTAAADAETIDFANDEVGYGLCQWTYRTRKANLRAYAKNMSVSVGNEAMQVRFCIGELKEDYPDLWEELHYTTELNTATDKVCKTYEIPAVNNYETRRKFSRELYEKYGAELAGGNDPSTASGSPPLVGEVTDGRSAEAVYLAALLYKLGYDVLWFGLEACIKDYQQKTGAGSVNEIFVKLAKEK